MKLQKGITGFDATPNYTIEDLEKILKGIRLKTLGGDVEQFYKTCVGVIEDPALFRHGN